ncbi:MAG: transglutaminase-like domain-containing protein [Myxococcota bacterium]
MSVAGRPIGIEARTVGDRAVVRRTTLWLDLDGDPVVVRSAVALADDGWIDWTPERVRTGPERVDAPDVWPPTGPGPIRVLDRSAGTVEPAVVDLETDPDGATTRIGWTTPAGRSVVTLDAGGRPIAAATGRIAAVRVDRRPPDPEPVDPARILAIPVQRFPNARRSHVGVVRVDGVEVRVEAPIDAELPPERVRVRAVVDDVADRLVDAVVVGSDDGAAALAAGRGDCTEHAVALVEAARAAGFDARTAAGRVYVDGPDGPELALHAWAEVRLGERWVAADAALRQFPADASHLRLGAWVAELAAADPASITIDTLR